MSSFANSTLNAGRVSRPHGIKPVTAVWVGQDWGEQALYKTWRSAGTLLILMGLAHAFLARLPAVVLVFLGIWAQLKGHPEVLRRLQAALRTRLHR